MPSTSSAVYRRSIGRPEIVVKLAARSGDFFSVGSSVSCSHRAFPLSATVFIQTALYPPPLSEKTRRQPARKSQSTGRRDVAATNFHRHCLDHEIAVLSGSCTLRAASVGNGRAGTARA